MDHPPPYFFLVSLNRLSNSLVRSGLLGIFEVFIEVTRGDYRKAVHTFASPLSDLPAFSRLRAMDGMTRFTFSQKVSCRRRGASGSGSECRLLDGADGLYGGAVSVYTFAS